MHLINLRAGVAERVDMATDRAYTFNIFDPFTAVAWNTSQASAVPTSGWVTPGPEPFVAPAGTGGTLWVRNTLASRFGWETSYDPLTEVLTRPLVAHPSLPPVVAPRTLVFGLFGQSNMLGVDAGGINGDDGGEDYADNILEYTQRLGLKAPTSRGPLQHANAAGNGLASIGIGFANAYAAANPQDTVILVPAAVSGTGFWDNDWNPGDPEYTAAVAGMNAALALDPSYEVGGILWHQGEHDGVNNQSAAYEAAITSMITGMRSTITGASEAPFIVGGLRPDFNLAQIPAVKAIHEGIGGTLDYAAYAASTGLTGDDDKHFNPVGVRTLGSRMYDALSTARADTPGAPAQVTGLGAVPSDGAVSLTWSAVAGASTYRLERSLTSGSGFSALTTIGSLSYTDTTPINETTYYYRVRANNGVGAGPYSLEVTATPAGVGAALTVLASGYSNSTVETTQNVKTETLPASSGSPLLAIVHASAGGGNVLPTSVTIGGVTATQLVGEFGTSTGSTSIWIIDSAPTNSVDVVATFPQAVSFASIGSVALNRVPVVHATAVDGLVGGTTSKDVPIGVDAGLVISAATSRGNNLPAGFTYPAGTGASQYAEIARTNVTASVSVGTYTGTIASEAVAATHTVAPAASVVAMVALK